MHWYLWVHMLCVLTFKEGHVGHNEKHYAPQAVVWSVISLRPLLILFGPVPLKIPGGGKGHKTNSLNYAVFFLIMQGYWRLLQSVLIWKFIESFISHKNFSGCSVFSTVKSKLDVMTASMCALSFCSCFLSLSFSLVPWRNPGTMKLC